MESWRDGEMERWRDGEMERWRDGEMERWGEEIDFKELNSLSSAPVKNTFLKRASGREPFFYENCN